jgi:hypothetical protein
MDDRIRHVVEKLPPLPLWVLVLELLVAIILTFLLFLKALLI